MTSRVLKLAGASILTLGVIIGLATPETGDPAALPGLLMLTGLGLFVAGRF